MKKNYDTTQYNLVVCGGTFDHFHQGHGAFLKSILLQSKQVLLGITTDAYTRKYKSNFLSIQSFAQRKLAVETFLKKQHRLDSVTIGSIDTIVYPLSWEALPIEAIMVTQETKKGAEVVNQERAKRNMSQLKIIEVSLVPDDTNQKISSTNIRKGKINTGGTSYVQSSWFAKDLFLPEVEKQWFKNPFGVLHRDTAFLLQENPQVLVAVGDVVTQECNTLSLKQKISVIDFTIQRKHTFQQIQELGFSGNELVLHAKNGQSHLTRSLFQAINTAIAQIEKEGKIIIIVDGEEDLAVIPLVLALPLRFVIVYGQPNQGIVRLPVTVEAKDRAYALLQKFVS